MNDFHSTLKTASIAELAILFRVSLRIVAALEDEGNRPASGGYAPLLRWQEEADGRLGEVAEEIRGRKPQTQEEGEIRFRCLAAYGSMICVSEDDLRHLGQTCDIAGDTYNLAV